jgi:hypothetical protein
VHKASRVLLEFRVIKGFKELLVQELKEFKVMLDLKVSRELKAFKVRLDQELKVFRVIKVTKASRVLRAYRVKLAPRVYRELRVFRVR